MDPVTIGILGAVGLLLLIAAGVPIAFAMSLVGIVGLLVLAGPTQTLSQLSLNTWDKSTDFVLVALPMFVLMGQLVFHMGIARDLYDAVQKWLGRMPGGLAVTTIVASAGFGAVTGVSAAAVATIGTMAIPELKRYGYSDTLSTGSIAASGTLAILIPPSVLMIIFGIWTETSIGDLFVAGIIPGLMLTAIFVGIIVLICTINPEAGPSGESSTWPERFQALMATGPIFGIFFVVVGGIYLGLFTPTEASAIGAGAVLVFGLASRRLSMQGFVRSLLDTGVTTGMIFAVIIGGHLIARFFVLTDITPLIVQWVAQADLSPITLLLLVTLMYFVLGALLDVWGMLILTLPFTFPIMVEAGYDPVWIGIYVVLMTELALITPPVGVNVYVMKGIAQDVPLGKIFLGITPFVVGILLLLVMITIFPQLVLFLPGR